LGQGHGQGKDVSAVSSFVFEIWIEALQPHFFEYFFGCVVKIRATSFFIYFLDCGAAIQGFTQL